jgi:formylglycine-generating enzyme required for sulfatase activity/tRNA A-37 threonylcarbamoyl transferase component Bud32
MTGAMFGRYEIKGELGRGGMATVYHAFDPRFRREVAIKVLPHEFLHDQTFRARFEREAQSIAGLEHSAIVPVHDFGEEEGQPFLVIRFMPGGSLADWIRQGPLPLGEITTIMDRICAALDFAHSKGIIHRDVKPANILFDEPGDPYLSDFGIVKVAETTAQLTGSGIVGTPAYMAPEMARRGGITPLIDVYALAVTLYQMLTGQLPYDAETPMGLLMAHLGEPIPDARVLRPDLPDAVQAVIERGMAKDPGERYATAGELAAALHTALSTADEVEAPLETIPLPLRPRVQPIAGTVPATEPVAEAVTPPDDVVQLPTVPEEPSAVAEPVVAKRAAPRRGLPVWVWVIGVLGVGLAAAVVLVGVLAAVGVIEFGGAAPPESVGAIGVTHNADWAPEIHEFDGVKMALVPAGCFMMGSEGGMSDERPVHQVCFEEPFWIDVYEVTNVQYGSVASDCTQYSSLGNQPRVCIDWFDSVAHCQSRGARLPTEAEWEYAVRGPDGLVYPWGDNFVENNIVYSRNSGNRIWEVGSKPGGVSWVGAYDLSGNVWEWVNDWYADSYPGEARVNPAGPVDGKYRVLRGGSWNSFSYGVRAAYRSRSYPSYVSHINGFRCARSY